MHKGSSKKQIVFQVCTRLLPGDLQEVGSNRSHVQHSHPGSCNLSKWSRNFCMLCFISHRPRCKNSNQNRSNTHLIQIDYRFTFMDIIYIIYAYIYISYYTIYYIYIWVIYKHICTLKILKIACITFPSVSAPLAEVRGASSWHLALHLASNAWQQVLIRVEVLKLTRNRKMKVWIKQHDESCNYSCTSFCFAHMSTRQNLRQFGTVTPGHWYLILSWNSQEL